MENTMMIGKGGLGIMKRMYVIMCDLYNGAEYLETYPEDVVSSLNQAEELCTEYETNNPDGIYYWREVISSEN